MAEHQDCLHAISFCVTTKPSKLFKTVLTFALELGGHVRRT
jgi:hypothetical protein